MTRPRSRRVRFTGCPHCESVRFLPGPRGGMSQNIACERCGARFNVAFFGRGFPPVLLEELSGPGDVDPDLFGGYIIELVSSSPPPDFIEV